jgi:hypothetical protein
VFNLLFLRLQTKRIAGIAVTVGVWCFVFSIDIFGPAVLEKTKLGPYFGVAGMLAGPSARLQGLILMLELPLLAAE